MVIKSIDTLVNDIRELLDKGLDSLPEGSVEAFGERMGKTLASRVLSEAMEERKPGFRMSSIGKPCIRQLWYSYHFPEEKEVLDASVKLKFLYGDLTEEFVLFLAELSGHRVEGRQDTLTISGVDGHRDAIIDGVVVDVKSASTYSFKKFADHLNPSTDSFGYLDQLQSYLHASREDDLVTDKSRGAFLVIDKTLGHICLDFHDYIPYDWESEYERRKAIIGNREVTPPRGFSPQPDGKSGNEKLPVNCSYCDVKRLCHPNVRGFSYSTGPVYLTRVAREPNVPEFKV